MTQTVLDELCAAAGIERAYRDQFEPSADFKEPAGILAVSAVGFSAFATLGSDSGLWLFIAATLIIGAGAALAMTPVANSR